MPNFDLTLYNPLTDDVEKKTINDFRGKWLVLCFYPADFTFVCPTELKDLNQKFEEIQQMGNVEAMVVSVDSVFSHKSRINSEELLKGFKFPMEQQLYQDILEFSIMIQETQKEELSLFLQMGS